LTDYVTISDTSVDPDAPLTYQLAYAWRDNPIAISEGAVGAPRVQLGAFPRLIVGATARHTSAKSAFVGGSDPVSVSWSFPFVQGGTVRVTLSGMATGETLDITRTRAGTLTTLHSVSGASGNANYDVTVLPGDAFSVSVSSTGSVSATVVLSTDASIDIFPIGGDFVGNYVGNALS